MSNLESTDLISSKYTVSQEEINSFAKKSGGMGSIHTDPEYAQKTFFKKTLVHGLYMLAIIEKEAHFQFKGSNIKTIEVNYLKPIVVNQEFHIKFIQKQVNDWELSVLTNDKPMIIGTFTL